MPQDKLVSLLIGLEDGFNHLQRLALLFDLINQQFNQPDDENFLIKVEMLIDLLQREQGAVLEGMESDFRKLAEIRNCLRNPIGGSNEE